MAPDEERRSPLKFGPWLTNAVQQLAPSPVGPSWVSDHDDQPSAPRQRPRSFGGSAATGEARFLTQGTLSRGYVKKPMPGGYADLSAIMGRDVVTQHRATSSHNSPVAKKRGLCQTPIPPAPESVDAAVRLFIDSHPGFRSEVWCISPGRYLIRGRDVTELTDASQPVLVDGWQRPLDEVLQECFQEYTLEFKAKAGDMARRIVRDLFLQEVQRSNDDLLRSCLQALRTSTPQGRGRTRLAALRMGLLRHSWAAWIRYTSLNRGDTNSFERLRSMSQFHQRLLVHSGVQEICWSAWRLYAQRSVSEKNHVMNNQVIDASYARLCNLQVTLPLAINTGFQTREASLSVFCFLRWAWEVQGRKRRSAEAFLVGQQGLLKSELEQIESQGKAKELLVSTWDGPEAQLSRLSGVVDGFIKRLDVKGRMPILTEAVQRAANEELQPWQKTMHAFEEMNYVHRSALQLEYDIAYVLALRCFSGWMRVARDAREARGQTVLDMRANDLTAKSHVLLARMENILRVSLSNRTLRKVYTSWAQTVQGLVSAAMLPREGIELRRAQRVNEISHREAEAMARHTCHYHRIATDQHVLLIIMSRWFGEVLQARQVEHVNDWDNMLEHMDNQKKVRKASSHAASDMRFFLTQRRPLRAVVVRWHLCAHRSAVARQRQDHLRRFMGRHEIHQMRHAFLAFTTVLQTSGARRVMEQHLLYLMGSHALSMAGHCFRAWCGAILLAQAERRHAQSKEHFIIKKGRMTSKIETAVDLIARENQVADLRLVFDSWQRESVSAQQRACLRHLSEEQSALDTQKRLEKEHIRRIQIRAALRLDHLMTSPLRMAVFVLWATQAYKAAQDRRVAGDWLQRQRRQEFESATFKQIEQAAFNVSRILEGLIDANLQHLLAQCFKAWARTGPRLHVSNLSLNVFAASEIHSTKALVFNTWRQQALQRRKRHAAGRFGMILISSSNTAFLGNVMHVWRATAVERSSWKSAKRLLVLQALVPLMSRKPRSALRQWRENAREKYVTAEEQTAAKADALLGQRILAFWSWRSRASVLVKKELAGLKRHALRCWRTAMIEARHERWQARTCAGRQLREGYGILARTVDEQEKRRNAISTFIKWHRPDSNTLAIFCVNAFEYFAAWVLFVLGERQESRADVLAGRMVDLDVRYRAAGETLLGRAAVRYYQLTLVLECWAALKSILPIKPMNQQVAVDSRRFCNVRDAFAQHVGNNLRALICVRQCFKSLVHYWKSHRRQSLSLRRNVEHRLFRLLMDSWMSWSALANRFNRVRHKLLRLQLEGVEKRSARKCMIGWLYVSSIAGRASTVREMVELMRKVVLDKLSYMCLMRWAHASWLEATAAMSTYMDLIGVKEQNQARALLKDMMKRRRENHLWRIVVSTEALMDLRIAMQSHILQAWRSLWWLKKRQVLISCFINRVVPATMSLTQVSFLLWARRSEVLQESEIDMADASAASLAPENTPATMASRILSGSARGLPPRRSFPSPRHRVEFLVEEEDRDVSRGRQPYRSESSRSGTASDLNA